MSDEQNLANEGTQAMLRRGIQKKLILAGIIQLTVFFGIIFLYLPFLMNELRQDILEQRHLAQRLKAKEVETIARFLAFELGRLPLLNDLKAAFYCSGAKEDATVIEMKSAVERRLWEKCAFNEEIIYVDLVAPVGDSVLRIAPYGEEAAKRYFAEMNLREVAAVAKLTKVSRPDGGDGEYIQRYVMPLYVEGGRWGITRIVISTEDFKVVDANVADREHFKQTSFFVFALTTLAGFGVGLLVFNYCARQVSEPLNRLTATIERFGKEHDFDRLLDKLAEDMHDEADAVDEVGLLTRAFRQMAENLNRTMSRLHFTIEEKEEAVAEREKALVELRDSERALHESAKLATLGEIGASFAHEINNKIQPAKITTVALLEEDAGPHVTRDDLESILNSINDCARYVDKFKAFARPEHRREDDVNVNDVIRDVLDLVQKPLLKSNVRISTDLAEGLPNISGDPSELAQVFMNLLFNARDAIEPTLSRSKPEGTVRIRTWADGRKVKVAVADDGVGMSREVRSKLFTPFFTTKGLAKGTGLGLSISKRIVEDHGGTIDVESREGKGTAFTLIFGE
ncbi:MAG: ATP-binding protein [Planctomycetota bacterium]